MKERPILFSDQRVKALLSGIQTQTRRIMKAMPFAPGQDNHESCYGFDVLSNHLQGNSVLSMGDLRYHCPYGQPGDRLWVRETWRGPIVPADEIATWENTPNRFRHPGYCQYRADASELSDNRDVTNVGWRAGIHMPRWASRIDLEITHIRVEKIQHISDDDIMAEGVQSDTHFLNNFFTLHTQAPSPKEAYRTHWSQQYGAASWDVNPWVWVINFRRAATEQ